MRPVLVLLHRWLGLFTAVFLCVAGLSGAVISWEHELDEWLNPHLFQARGQGAPGAPLDLAARLEAEEPRLLVSYVPLGLEPGRALGLGVSARTDPATGAADPLPFNQVALDPSTGEVQDRRLWGAVSLSRENLLPFLYKLHYSLHLPERGGFEYGVVFMGLVAIVWVLDSGVALLLSFPKRSAWRQSFAFRIKSGGYPLVFDLHRSGGVWAFALLLVLAVTSVSMNLGPQVVRPLVSTLSPLTPTPFQSRTPRPPDRPIEPRIDRARAVEIAAAEASRRGLAAPAGAVFYSPEFGIYGVGFFEAGHDHGDGGLGNPWVYLDGGDGRLLGAEVPGQGSAGDVFMQAQFPLHSGRILGLAGRILVSFMGLVVATVSITGVVIWTRKRRARLRAKALDSTAPGRLPILAVAGAEEVD